jgi:hypothetical protein
MKEPQNHLPRDLKALRYLDALNAGDLEATSALWEEASHDPDLERMLAELDGALFVEEAGENRKADIERDQGLIQKHLPGGMPFRRPRAVRGRWVGMAAALAAACLLAFFTWPGRDDKNPVPGTPTNESAHEIAPRPSGQNESIAGWRQYRRVLDEGEMPTFHWPLPGDATQLGINLDSSLTARFNERNRPL